MNIYEEALTEYSSDEDKEHLKRDIEQVMRQIKEDNLSYSNEVFLKSLEGDPVSNERDENGEIPGLVKGLREAWRVQVAKRRAAEELINYLGIPRRKGAIQILDLYDMLSDEEQAKDFVAKLRFRSFL